MPTCKELGLGWFRVRILVYGRRASACSFASAEAISAQDGACQACHGGSTRMLSPSLLQNATLSAGPARTEVQ